MKIYIDMKTADAISNAIEDIEDDRQKEEIKQLAEKWFRFGECITVVLDTEAKTCIVRG